MPANVAEGHARGTRRDYAQFAAVAKGSLMELETYIMSSERLGYLTAGAAQPLLDQISELSRMLTALRRRLLESST